jgi:hypothetical protein
MFWGLCREHAQDFPPGSSEADLDWALFGSIPVAVDKGSLERDSEYCLAASDVPAYYETM